MKRFIACFLTLVMIFSGFPVNVFVTGVNAQEEIDQKSEEQILEGGFSSNINEEKTASDTTREESVQESGLLSGKMEVEVSLPLPVKAIPDRSMLLLTYGDAKSVNIELAGTPENSIDIGGQKVSYKIQKLGKKLNDSEREGGSIPLEDGDSIYYIGINFTNLPAQLYTISLQNELLSEKTEVDLKEESQRLTLPMGSVLMGDVNKDGVIDKSDYESILAKVETKDSVYDLNADGVVDITDLVYVQENIGNQPGKGILTGIGKIFDPAMVTLENAKDIKIDGDLKTLFSSDINNQTVTFEKIGDKTISKESPLEVQMNLDESASITASQIRITPNELTTDNAPKKGEVIVEYVGGAPQEVVPFGEEENTDYVLLTEEPTNNTIIINLKGQVAIKKVTLKIFGTVSNNNLVEISKVEFLNNVKDQIVQQESSIPANVKAEAGDETVIITWSTQTNVTGYEVEWTYIDPKTNQYTKKAEVVDETRLELKKLENYVEYTFMVRALNGSWISGYSAPVKVTPVPAVAPSAPEGVMLVGGYRQITATWKKQKQSTGYNLYYREKGTTEYKKADNINALSYTISDLKDQKEYQIYLTGYNGIGEGQKSGVYECATQSIAPPKTPNYKLLNTSNGLNEKTNHIINVKYPSPIIKDDYPDEYNEFDIVDDDYTSYWNYNGWNTGGLGGQNKAPIVEFDEAYEMTELVLVRGDDEPSSYAYANICYWDADGKMIQLEKEKDFTLFQKKDKEGKEYYQVHLFNKIKAKKLQINTALYWAGAPNARNRISELKFYHYDSLADDVNALFADDIHVELKPGTTLDKIVELENRLNTNDPVSGEYHPQKDSLMFDIDLAKALLEDQADLKGIITVDQMLTNTKNNNLQFSMSLNDFQPLGVAARAGETVTIYVGTKGNTLPKLVYTQFHADIKSGWSGEINLRKGRNEITIPQIGGADSERGGALYVRYPSDKATQDKIKVRVAGATIIPVLNTAGMKTEDEIKGAIKTYIGDLKNYVNNKLPEIYTVSGSFSSANSIYNTTDLVSDRAMLTLPADAVWKDLKTKSETEQIDQLYNNINGFGQLTDIAYKNWRGLLDTSDAGKNALPSSRINIRYSRMFTGAFMYATGGHIGIEYNSTAGVITGKPHTKGNDGLWQGGSLYGWGIAHEVGHVMDQSGGKYSETTNNVLSLYAQTYDEKTVSRMNYTDVYKKVTSGTKGISNNVFTQLGMFWQLHLAYDTKANDFNNTDTFHDKLSRAYRENATSTNDTDNLLIRMASDAAKKDLTEYFEKWGLSPNKETQDYIKTKGYEKEERALYYLNDDARHKRDGIGVEKVAPMQNGTKITASLDHKIIDGKDNKTVTLNLGVTSNQKESILGYEIYRNDKIIGFTNESTYTDIVSSVNNRVMNYKAVAYDYQLNKTDAFVFDPIKISHDGSLSKSRWEISSTMTSDEDKITEDNLDFIQNKSLEKLINDDYKDSYKGQKSKNNPEIVIDMNQSQTVAGFKYTAAVENGALAVNTIGKYTIAVSEDGVNFKEVTSGTFDSTVEKPENTVYFNEKGQEGANQLVTYRAEFVRIIATGAAGISGAEIDIIGPPGDNVELSENGMGILEEDFTYGEKQEDIIKKGSLVFTGSYRGHPAYNSVLLFDEKGNNVVGKTAESAHMIIMATIPPNGNIGEISDGTWVYWIDSDQFDQTLLPKEVRAELYRVDNMDTQEGQRLVSDTLKVSMPSSLPNIKLTGAVIPNIQTEKVK